MPSTPGRDPVMMIPDPASPTSPAPRAASSPVDLLASLRATDTAVEDVPARLLDGGLDRVVLRSPVADADLVAAFGTLPVRYQQVIWWCEVEGLSAAEIGRRLRISTNAAAALSFRARRALRDACATETGALP